MRTGCGTPTPFSHRGCAGLRPDVAIPWAGPPGASEALSTSALAWLTLGPLSHPACGSVGLPGTYPMPACEITTLLQTPGRAVGVSCRDLSLRPPRYQTDPPDSPFINCDCGIGLQLHSFCRHSRCPRCALGRAWGLELTLLTPSPGIPAWGLVVNLFP